MCLIEVRHFSPNGPSLVADVLNIIIMTKVAPIIGPAIGIGWYRTRYRLCHNEHVTFVSKWCLHNCNICVAAALYATLIVVAGCLWKRQEGRRRQCGRILTLMKMRSLQRAKCVDIRFPIEVPFTDFKKVKIESEFMTLPTPVLSSFTEEWERWLPWIPSCFLWCWILLNWIPIGTQISEIV